MPGRRPFLRRDSEWKAQKKYPLKNTKNLDTCAIFHTPRRTTWGQGSRTKNICRYCINLSNASWVQPLQRLCYVIIVDRKSAEYSQVLYRGWVSPVLPIDYEENTGPICDRTVQMWFQHAIHQQQSKSAGHSGSVRAYMYRLVSSVMAISWTIPDGVTEPMGVKLTLFWTSALAPEKKGTLPSDATTIRRIGAITARLDHVCNSHSPGEATPPPRRCHLVKIISLNIRRQESTNDEPGRWCEPLNDNSQEMGSVWNHPNNDLRGCSLRSNFAAPWFLTALPRVSNERKDSR